MVYFIPTPIGNPQDITIRSLSYFNKTDLFLCEDIRKTKQLFRLFSDRDIFNFNFPNVDFLTLNEHNFHNQIKFISNRLNSEIVSYVTDAGMPSISDPGEQLVTYCQLNNIDYDVLTGANALTTAYVASGFKDVQFIFYGFLAKIGKQRTIELKKIMKNSYNIIIYESPLRVIKLLNEIIKIDKNRNIFIAKELTKKFQFYKKDLAINILEKLKKTVIKGEWIIILEGDKNYSYNHIDYDDLIDLKISPKIKAKLLSKIGNQNIKYFYNKIINISK